MQESSVLQFKEHNLSSGVGIKLEKNTIPFRSRFMNSCAIDIEQTTNSITKYLIAGSNESINKEMLNFINQSLSLTAAEEINIKILNLFLSVKDKYILINFENKNFVVQNEKEFIDFIQKLNISILRKENSNNKIVYASTLNLDSEESHYCYCSSISYLSGNELQDTLILSIHLNSLFQKILLSAYKELKLEIKKNLEKKLPTVG